MEESFTLRLVAGCTQAAVESSKTSKQEMSWVLSSEVRYHEIL